jgi:hypothetical protein
MADFAFLENFFAFDGIAFRLGGGGERCQRKSGSCNSDYFLHAR